MLERDALLRLAELVTTRGTALTRDPADVSKTRSQFSDPPLAVAVIEVQKPSEKVPPIEQSYSAGAVCLGLLNAALAAGWGATWLTGWPAHDRGFVEAGLGLEGHERVAGFIYIGTGKASPSRTPATGSPEAIVTWVSE